MILSDILSISTVKTMIKMTKVSSKLDIKIIIDFW